MKEQSGNTIQAFWVLFGSLSAFFFTLISSMLLSRYFDKHEYGTYKQVMYVYSSLVVVFTLGLPKAFSYFLPRVTNGQAKDLINKLNLILFSLGLVMSCCLFFGAHIFASLLNNEDLELPLKYFSLIPMFLLPTMGLEGILSTYRKTKFLALYNILSKIFMLLCVVVPVIFYKGDVNSAIIGFTVSSFLCFVTAIYFKNYPIKKDKKEKSPVSFNDILRYTLPLMGASIWGIIISSSDQFFISRFFGNEVFADFSNGSLELPFVAMIISSATTVLAPVFARQVYEQGNEAKTEILALWHSVLIKTVKIIYPLVVFCFCFADVIMVILYGDRYENSGIYFQIKLLINFFTVIAYAPLMLAIGGEKYYFKIHMGGAIILILLEWISVLIFESPYVVTVVSVVCQLGRILAMLLYISKYFNIKLFELFPIRLMAIIVFPSIIVLFPLKYVLFEFFHLSQILYLSIALVVYLLLYGCWAYYKKIDYFVIVKPLVKKIFK